MCINRGYVNVKFLAPIIIYRVTIVCLYSLRTYTQLDKGCSETFCNISVNLKLLHKQRHAKLPTTLSY